MDELDRMYRRLVQNIRAGFPDLLTRAFEVSLIYQQIIPYRLNRRELGLDSNDEYELTLLRLLSGERGLLGGDDEMQRALRAELDSPNPDLSAFRAYATSTVSLVPEALRAHDAQPQVRGISPSSAPVPERPAAAPSMAPAAAGAPATAPADAPAAAPAAAPLAAPAPATAPMRPAAARPPAAAPAAARAAAQAAAPAPPPAEIAARATEEISVTGMSTQAAAAAPAHERTRSAASKGPAAMSRPTPAGCRYCGGELPAGRDVHFCPHCGQNLTIKQCPACSTELDVAWQYCVNCGRQVE